MRKLQHASARQFLLLSCFGLLYAATSGDDGDTAVSCAEPSTSANITHLLNSPLVSQAGRLTPGRWCIPGLVWTFQQGLVTADSEDRHDAVTVHPVRPVPFDHSVLQIIHSLMKRDREQGLQIHYRVNREDFQGTATTLLTKHGEIPVAVHVRWPAANGEWTELSAVRDGSESAAEPMLKLPVEQSVIATRISPTGSPTCQFVAFPTSSAGLIQALQSQGCRVERPPGSGTDSKVCWIASGQRQFELRFRRVAGEATTTAFIRSI
jgi:hypothetical protein